jgi:MFS family permease
LSNVKQVIAWDEWRQYGSIMPACVFGMVLVAMHAYSLGVMIVPLEKEFGWSRSQISAGPLVTSIATLLMAPIAGRLLDKHGPRKVALLGVPVFGLCIGMLSLAGPSIYSWLALYAVLAVALLMVFPTVWTAAIAMRFEKNRGLAMALALSGTGITSAIVPAITAHLVEAYGWRGAYIGLGTMSVVVVFPLILLLFDRDDTHRRVAQQTASVLRRLAAKNKFKQPRFLLLAAAALLYSIGATGLGINAVPILMEEGFNLSRAAEIAGLIGIGTITGRILGGLLLDHMDGRFVAVGCGMAAMTMAAILLWTEQSVGAGSVACFFLGLAAGAEYDACAYLTTRHFPHRDFGALFGLIGALSGVGAGVAPMIANAIYDVMMTYQAVLWGVFPLFTVASILFLMMGPYPDNADLA